MQGELIGEFRGKTAGQRVAEILPSGPRMEITFKKSGKLLSVDANDIATYWSIMTLPDVMYGEGQGAVMSKSGEMAMYRDDENGQERADARLAGCPLYAKPTPKVGRTRTAKRLSTSTRWTRMKIRM